MGLGRQGSEPWSQTCGAGHWECSHPVLPPGDVLRLHQAPESVQFAVGPVYLDDSYQLFIPQLIKSCQGHWVNIIMIRSLDSGSGGTNPVGVPARLEALCHVRRTHCLISPWHGLNLTWSGHHRLRSTHQLSSTAGCNGHVAPKQLS